MAQKRQASSGGASKKSDETPRANIHLKLSPDVSAKYANYVSLSRSPYDFEVCFWRIPSIAPVPGKVIVEKNADHVATIVLPYEVARSLAEALRDQWDKFVGDDTFHLGKAYGAWADQQFGSETR